MIAPTSYHLFNRETHFIQFNDLKIEMLNCQKLLMYYKLKDLTISLIHRFDNKSHSCVLK